MTVTTIDFDTNFRPTPEQVIYAAKYARDFGLDSVFVAVNFPGKERGIWAWGQTREAVMDEHNTNVFALWVELENALADLELGHAGNAVFRVYAHGQVHLVEEA